MESQRNLELQMFSNSSSSMDTGSEKVMLEDSMSTEQEEFLPHESAVKKKVQFTDVSTRSFRHLQAEKTHCADEGVASDCLCPPHSLKGRRPLECPSSTSAMPSWGAVFWGWHTPCQTLGSSSSCK
ncbi:hypothetical protein ANANG_G00217570 [Anguilla anguilla]|uniref:Uncharacterized protein n=1 Tax=Anguilla anguilla TaxID=7936 RepID=A0A9D3RPR8_ANGAN|nr:hypothetical protein ANANG_G00217570 [Anguilla anguilla]